MLKKTTKLSGAVNKNLGCKLALLTNNAYSIFIVPGILMTNIHHCPECQSLVTQELLSTTYERGVVYMSQNLGKM